MGAGLHNINFWRDYFQRMYVPHIDRLLDVLEQRVMPAFASIDAEATVVQQRALDELESRPVYSDFHDGSEIVEAAFQEGLDYYNGMAAVKQTLLNSFAPILYHVWEQQLLSFHRRQILRPSEASDENFLSIRCVRTRLQQSGRDIRKLASWPVLMELRQAANTVKHAEGGAARDLQKVRPDLFLNPDFVSDVSASRRPLGFSPLAGDDLYLKLSDLRVYGQAARDFWTQFTTLLEDDPPKAVCPGSIGGIRR